MTEELSNPCLDSTTVCAFRIVNGSLLAFIGLAGFILCLVVIYWIVFNVIQLPGEQNIFVLNVLLIDTMIAVSSLIRGLGIISRRFIGVVEDKETWFCYVYPLVAGCFWCAALPSLLPLTIDRFIAVVFPLKHKSLITPRVSILMLISQWIPSIAMTIYEVIGYHQGDPMKYVHAAHRCVLKSNDYVKMCDAIFFTMGPTTAIVVLYVIMIATIVKSGRSCRKIFLTSSVIVVSGLIAALPDTIEDCGVDMGYYTKMVLTLTLYYVICVVDPLVYFYSNPWIKYRMQRIYLQPSNSGAGRRTSRV